MYSRKKCGKRILCVALAALWLFMETVPVYGAELKQFGERIREEREIAAREKEQQQLMEEIFSYEEGITLSQNGIFEESTKEESRADNPLDTTQEEASTLILRQPEFTEEDDPDRLYGEPVEIGKFYRTYQMPDGTYTTVFTSYANTYEENGEEKLIDNTLVSGNDAAGSVYTNKDNDMEVSLPGEDNEEHSVKIEEADTKAVIVPEDGDYTNPAVSENAVRYNNVYQFVDVQYTVQPDGVKQDIILTAPQERNSFIYRLKKNGILAVQEGESICLYPEGTVSGNDEEVRPVMIISAPRMEDAVGAASEAVTLKLTEKEDYYEILLAADEKWLLADERVYPIKIDPSTLVLKDQITSYTIGSLCGALPLETNSHAGYFDGLGFTRTYVISAYLYQSLRDGYGNVDILSAELKVYQLNNASGYKIGCYRLADRLPRQNQNWGNTVGLNRYAAGENAISNAGYGWHTFDVRDSVNGWVRGTYDSHGLVLIIDNETKPGVALANSNYPDATLRPTITIEWQPGGDVPLDYGIDDTTVNLRPMVLTTTDGKLQCYGVFGDGLVKPEATLRYNLSPAETEGEKAYLGTVIAGNSKKYPNSAAFQSAFPAGTLRYADSQSNWQTRSPFTEFEYDKVYTMMAQAAYRDKIGKKVSSDEFLIYRVTRFDTLEKIAAYYGVPLSTIMFDNKVADMLLVENNTLFIRSPKQNKNKPYQPAELTDEEKARIDSALLGRARHCEFGFEPINLNTGNFYLSQEDFSYTDSYGTLQIQRSYNSLQPGRLGSFGRGFTSIFDEGLGAGEGGILYYNRQDGSTLTFVPDGDGGYITPEGHQINLERKKTGEKTGTFSSGEQRYPIYSYTITEEDDSRHTFDEKGNLIEIRYENGSVITFIRNEAGMLKSLVRGEVTIGIQTDANGCIASITLPNGGIYRYGYDADQNLISVTNPLGGVKRFSYDDTHRMTEWHDEKGVRIVSNTYDDNNRVIRQVNDLGGVITLEYGQGYTISTDAKGNVTRYDYDEGGRTTAITYADGSREIREYEQSLMTKSIDPEGVVTSFVYDENGNITEKIVNGNTTYFAYDENENLVRTEDALGNVSTARYDQAGNMTDMALPDGTQRSYVYDSKNRLIQETDGNGNRIGYTYNGGRLTGITLNDRITASYTYNNLGLVTNETDGEGNTTSYSYDLMGRNTGITMPEGGTWHFAYDPIGLLKGMENPLGGSVYYTYNNSCSIASMTDENGNTWHYEYDLNDNQISETDPYGNRTLMEYDSRDRLILVTDAKGNQYRYEYDGCGRLIRQIDPLGHVEKLSYDPATGMVNSMINGEGVETAYTYDALGNLTCIRRAGVTIENYEYDAMGRPIKITHANGAATVYTYDGNGNILSKEEGEDRITLYEYDDRDQLIKETTPLGEVYGYAYDKAGRLVRATDPLEGEISYAYDKNGNPVKITDEEGNSVLYAYDEAGNVTAITMPEGGIYRYAYDKAGNLTAEADERGFVTQYAYDKTGNLMKTTDPLGGIYSYEWDQLGQLTKITDTNGGSYTYAYDGAGNLIKETDALGNETSYAYDGAGRCIAVTDALFHTTTYEYDQFDRIIKEKNALGGIKQYEYDLMGWMTASVDERGSRQETKYDLYGNILQQTDANGNKTLYNYDKEDRLIQVTDAEGNRASSVYDGKGNMLSLTGPMGEVTSYTYDKTGRLLTQTASDGGVTGYTYDKDGRAVKITDPLGNESIAEYDASGNLIKAIDESGNATSYEYDGNGNCIKVTYADGAEDLFAYDKEGNLLYTKEGNIRFTSYEYDLAGRLIQTKDVFGNASSYQYDKAGNLVLETAPDGTRTQYAYDSLNRLIRETLPNEGNYDYAYDESGNLIKVTGPTGITNEYAYDKAGNLISQAKAGHTTSYTYDRLNRVSAITDALGGKTVYAYDKGGNLSSVTYADGSLYQYRYDGEGRVTNVRTPSGADLSMNYDLKGQLLSQTEKGSGVAKITTYQYDERGSLTAVKDALGGTTSYEYDERGRVRMAAAPGGGQTLLSYDVLGNITELMDAEGGRTSYLYDAKGRLQYEDRAGLEHYTYSYDSMDRLIGVESDTSIVSYGYNALGQVSRVTDGNGNTASYEYDPAGNLVTTKDALGNHAQYTYDEAGNLKGYTNENGSTTGYDYDELNRLVKKNTGESLSEAAYAYDAMGRLTLMDDVTGESLYTYDGAGRLLTATDGNGKKLVYEYDAFDNVTKVTYPDGGSVTYTYDALDRMSSVTTLEGKTTRYEYDADGNVVKALREDGETRIAYDKLGRVLGLANYDKGRLISVYAYAYDDRGNITQEESRLYLEESTVEKKSFYHYDSMSQLIEAVEKESGKAAVTTTYTYDPAGNRLQMETKGAGETLRVDYTYDEAGRLVKEQDDQNGETTYTYDKAGNLISQVSKAGKVGQASARHYLYDASGRLSAVTDGNTLLLAALYDGSDNRTFTLEYAPELQNPGTGGGAMAEDASGRRGRRNGTEEVPDEDGLTTLALSDNIEDTVTDDRITETGDENTGKKTGVRAFWYGVLCQTADLILPAPTPFKTWLHGKMGFTDEITVLWEDEIWETDLSQTTMTVREAGSPFELLNEIYGGQSSQSLSNDAYRQVSYVNDTGYENAQVLLEYAQNGSKGNTVTGYSFGLWRESYQITTGTDSDAVLSIAGGSYYYTGTGSVSILTSGETMLGYSYEIGGSMTVYGNAASLSIYTQAASYSYNGEYTHEGLGLQYLRARYLNITTQTFTSKDSFTGTAKDILSQNRYTYAENNPVGNADPSGHITVKSNSVKKANSVFSSVKGKIGSTLAGIASSIKLKNSSTGKPSLLENIRICNGYTRYYNLISNTSTLRLMQMGMSYAKVIAEKEIAKMCLAYDPVVNDLPDRILSGEFNITEVIAESRVGNDFVSNDVRLKNGEYLYYALRQRGWSHKAAIAAVANAFVESKLNPGQVQNTLESAGNTHGNGIGLFQLDPENKFLYYFAQREWGYLGTEKAFYNSDEYYSRAKNEFNNLVNSDPNRLMDMEIDYLIDTSLNGKQWFEAKGYTGDFYMDYEEFITKKDISVQEMAMILRDSYEHSPNHARERQYYAELWDDHIRNGTDIKDKLGVDPPDDYDPPFK